MKNVILFKLLFVLALSSSSLSLAQNKCVDVFKTDANVISELQKITAGTVDIYNKKIPVVLVNRDSVDQLNELYNQSLGIVVAHQKGYNNDHGLFRLSDIFIDRDSPGQRHRGEINKTGISFASVQEYTAYTYKSKQSYNRIEVLFKLSESEYNTALVYQKMRRAAILRPDFSFGGDNNPKNVNNRMTDCGEICFSFSTGSSASSQANSAKRQAEKMGLLDLQKLTETKEFKTFFTTVDQYFLKASFSNTDLSPDIVTNFKIPKAIQKLKLAEKDQAELVRWVIGFNISKNYAELLQTLEISNSSDYSNVRSARASAVLVYDGAISKTDFANPNYISEGIFSTWRNTGFQALDKAP